MTTHERHMKAFRKAWEDERSESEVAIESSIDRLFGDPIREYNESRARLDQAERDLPSHPLVKGGQGKPSGRVLDSALIGAGCLIVVFAVWLCYLLIH